MKASAVIKRPSEVKGVVGNPLSITANVSKLGGASVIVDPELDDQSTNPVENKAITEAIDGLSRELGSLSSVVDGKADIGDIPVVPTNVSAFTNDAGYVNATQAASAAPVQSVNGRTGAVALTASDVGALPTSTTIPRKTSDLTNDSGFITAANAPVRSVNGQTGAVTLSIPTKVSDLTNDSGFISGITGNDVTSALGFTPYNSTNPSGYVNATQAANAAPVQSVNGQTGAVSLTIPVVPSDVSAFTNDAGYITSAGAPVQSVNGQTGAVSLTIPTVPTNVSAFTNDAGYLTLSTLPVYNGGVQ